MDSRSTEWKRKLLGAVIMCLMHGVDSGMGTSHKDAILQINMEDLTTIPMLCVIRYSG
jgi:hypothetical protein